MLGPHPPFGAFGKSPTPLMFAPDTLPSFHRELPPPEEEDRLWFKVYIDRKHENSTKPTDPIVMETKSNTSAKCFNFRWKPNVSTVWGRRHHRRRPPPPPLLSLSSPSLMTLPSAPILVLRPIVFYRFLDGCVKIKNLTEHDYWLSWQTFAI